MSRKLIAFTVLGVLLSGAIFARLFQTAGGSVLVLADPPVAPEPAKLAKYKAQPAEFWGKKLQSEKWEDVTEASEAILILGTGAKPIVPILLEMLDDRCPEYQVRAAELLAVVDPIAAQQAIPVLIKLIREEKNRYQAAELLRQNGRKAIPPLIELLGDSKPRVRRTAAFTLGEMKEEGRPAI